MAKKKKEMSLKKMGIVYGVPWALAGIWAIAAANGAFSDSDLSGEHAKAVNRLHPNLTVEEMGGYGWFDCGENGFYSTRFKAKDENGQQVDGTVCETFFTGSKTIRIK